MTNATNCCPASIPNCPNLIGNDVKATLSNLAFCSCATGSFTLSMSASAVEWNGSGSMGCTGQTVTLKLYLVGNTDCHDFRLDVSISPCLVGTKTFSPSTCDCSPLKLTFGAGPIDFCCGPMGPGQTMTVTIEE